MNWKVSNSGDARSAMAEDLAEVTVRGYRVKPLESTGHPNPSRVHNPEGIKCESSAKALSMSRGAGWFRALNLSDTKKPTRGEVFTFTMRNK